jgi:hypothetical protein
MTRDQNNPGTDSHPATPHTPKLQTNSMINLRYLALGHGACALIGSRAWRIWPKANGAIQWPMAGCYV